MISYGLNPPLLLTLMCFRLGILNEDLADWFGIAPSTCSSVFKTWIRLLSETLGKALVQWLPKESIMENILKALKKAGYSNVRVVIDCSEVFIERPKSLKSQAETWSDYISHTIPSNFWLVSLQHAALRASDRFILMVLIWQGISNSRGTYDEVL